MTTVGILIKRTNSSTRLIKLILKRLNIYIYIDNDIKSYTQTVKLKSTISIYDHNTSSVKEAVRKYYKLISDDERHDLKDIIDSMNII
jgi:hypothetical protein